MGVHISTRSIGHAIGKGVSSIGKSISKSVGRFGRELRNDPFSALTFGGMGTKFLTQNLLGSKINLTNAGLYAGAGFLLGGPVGAGIGAGFSLASQGSLGTGLQDLATLGASAQQRYLQKMYDAQNRAAQEQAKMAEEQNRQNLLQQIRATRIARAMNLADYAGETSVFSSGAYGNLGSIGSQYLSGLTSSVLMGQYANAYQTYMNQYNWYQTQAKNSEIRWNNRMNLLNFGLSVYGQGQGLQTAQLGNYYSSLRAANAWADVGNIQSQVSSSAPSTIYRGYYYNYGI